MVYTQQEMKEVYNKVDNEEKKYQKKILFFDYRIALQREEIITEINGKIETKSSANPGDFILTGSMNEKYVLPAAKFSSRYEVVEHRAKTKPVETLAKIYKGEPIRFIASWGEEMIIEPEDALINNNNEFYRIEKNAFNNTYKLKE